MGCCCKIAVLGLSVLAVFLGIKLYSCFQTPPLPQFENTWWGKGKLGKDDTSIKPFKINIDEKVLVDLKQRLQMARPFVPPLEGTQQQYGMNTNLLKEIVEFWKTKYDWKAREVFLNQFPQFKTQIQGLNIHYIHVKPTNVPKHVKVLPMLLLHGWPGSVREFYEAIPMLTKVQPNREFVFEVFVPSLPGYGFSDPAVRPGLGAAQMAVLFKNFMVQVGHKQFYAQGGDWGSIITTFMSILYPNHVLGLHTNFCFPQTVMSQIQLLIGSVFPSLIVEPHLADRMYPLSEKYSKIVEEMGYMHLQATKPNTIGAVLNETPVGLAAYILEKFTTWTNPNWDKLEDGGLTKKFTYTQLLDNIMIYWVTNSITTSQRLYAETFNKAHFSLRLEEQKVNVPSACANFKYELMFASETMLRAKHTNLVQNSNFEDGGHFAAFEEPKIFVEDVYSAVAKMVSKPKEKKIDL